MHIGSRARLCLVQNKHRPGGAAEAARREHVVSALGHKQTFAVQNGMSALHPKADMCGATKEMSAMCQ